MMDIRSFQSPEDLARVSRLLRSYWKERGMSFTEVWTKNYLVKGHALETAKEFQFVAHEGKTRLGYLSVILSLGGLAELRDFVVVPEHRGKGYGHSLLQHALALCHQLEVRKVIALVFPQTFPFYRQHGFFVEGLLKSHFTEGEDLLALGFFLKRRKEQQTDLKKTLHDLEEMSSIEKETSSRLLHMKSKPLKT